MLFKVRQRKEETETKKVLDVGVAGTLTKITGHRSQAQVTALLINN